MARHVRFTLVLNKDERHTIAALAAHLQRSQSDTVRYLIRNAARELAEQNHVQRDAAQQTGVTQNALALLICGLVIALLTCLAAWLVVPQVQAVINSLWAGTAIR